MDDDTEELEAADELNEEDFARYLERFKQKFPNANYTPELVETNGIVICRRSRSSCSSP